MKFLNRLLLVTTLGLSSMNIAVANDAVEQMKQFYKVADARPFDASKLKPFFSEKFTDHDASDAGHSSPEAVIGVFEALANAAPDSVHKITFIEPVSKNKALVRWKFVGSQTGELFGAPASGKKFDIAGMELWEFQNGKITGLWHVEELMKLFEQIKAD